MKLSPTFSRRTHTSRCIGKRASHYVHCCELGHQLTMCTKSLGNWEIGAPQVIMPNSEWQAGGKQSNSAMLLDHDHKRGLGRLRKNGLNLGCERGKNSEFRVEERASCWMVPFTYRACPSWLQILHWSGLDHLARSRWLNLPTFLQRANLEQPRRCWKKSGQGCFGGWRGKEEGARGTLWGTPVVVSPADHPSIPPSYKSHSRIFSSQPRFHTSILLFYKLVGLVWSSRCGFGETISTHRSSVYWLSVGSKHCRHPSPLNRSIHNKNKRPGRRWPTQSHLLYTHMAVSQEPNTPPEESSTRKSEGTFLYIFSWTVNTCNPRTFLQKSLTFSSRYLVARLHPWETSVEKSAVLGRDHNIIHKAPSSLLTMFTFIIIKIKNTLV